jgi:hypothetical protein
MNATSFISSREGSLMMAISAIQRREVTAQQARTSMTDSTLPFSWIEVQRLRALHGVLVK